jgi:hypothetical protein
MINDLIREVKSATYAGVVGTAFGTGIFYAADAVVSGAVSVRVGGFISGIIIGTAIKNDIISTNTGVLIASSILGTIIGLENFAYELCLGMTHASIISTGIGASMVGTRIGTRIAGAFADVDNNAEARAKDISSFLVACGAVARTISSAILSKLETNHDIADNIDSTNSDISDLFHLVSSNYTMDA